jgi:hypothetical protein
MHHATIKTCVDQFKRDFSTCGAPHPGQYKTVTTLEMTRQQ